MVEVLIRDVPSDANITRTQCVYKVKFYTEDVEGFPTRLIKLRSRLCLHGNINTEREAPRTYAAVVSRMGFLLVDAIICAKGMTIGKAEVRGAYTESGKARREVFLRQNFGTVAENYWFLLKIIRTALYPREGNCRGKLIKHLGLYRK